eukprot:750741-Hanusia_phi.AAC.1
MISISAPSLGSPRGRVEAARPPGTGRVPGSIRADSAVRGPGPSTTRRSTVRYLLTVNRTRATAVTVTVQADPGH